MADAEKKRLFIGGLHHALQEKDLRERFGRHGTISSLEIKTKRDSKGNPIKTFAHLDITITKNGLQKCMSIYNNTKWNGNTMQIQLAKESFIKRLEQERTCTADKEEVVIPRKPSHQAAAEKRLDENFEKAGVSDFIVKGKVPGTQIEGEKNWVVGKYGRVLPVVYIRRKDKQKIVCCDPSKYSHHLKKFKTDDNAGIGVPKVEQLTWDIPESYTEVTLKRKGIFTSSRSMVAKRKRVKERGMLAMRDYGSDQNDHSEFDEDDNDDNEDSGSVPTNEGPFQAIVIGERQPTDFEIVRDSSSVILPKPNSMFETKPGYDSDDRDSVDTDELCRSSSKISAGSQTIGVSRAKEGQKAALSKGHDVLISRVQQAHGKKQQSDVSCFGSINDGSRIQDDGAKLDDGDGWSSDVSAECKEHIEQRYKNYSDGEDFEPLTPNRTHSQCHEEANDLLVNEDDNEEDGKDDEHDEDKEEDDDDDVDDVHHETGERVSIECSDEGDGDLETWSSPIARFDFEPLILDRATISSRTFTETSGDQMEEGCNATENKKGSGVSEEDDKSDITDEDSDPENNDSKEIIGEVKMHYNNLENKKEIRSREENGQSQILRTVTLTKGKYKSDDSPKATTTALTPDEKKSLGGSDTLKSNTIQQKYDKSGRLLSKAATKKLAREEAEKQKEANERRLESMKQQQRALINRQVAIKGALSAVDDKHKKQGKHVTFDSEEEEDVETHETMFVEQKTQGSISLFDNVSDSGSEGLPSKDRGGKMWSDDEDEDDDEERFRIKPQFEGEAGQKLIRMEARYGGDKRFKLDTRFLEEEGNAELSKASSIGNLDEPSSELQEEKSRSLAILQNMLGTQLVASSKPVEPNFKDPCQLHYDPSRDEHSKYELPDDPQDDSDAKIVEQEMQKEKRKMEEERAKMPEVSNEKFFQVSSNLKDAFSGGEGRGEGGVKEDGGNQDAGGVFTFFGGDHSDGEEPQNDVDDHGSASDLGPSLFLSKKFKYDSSDDEDSLDDQHVHANTNQVSENDGEEDLVKTSVPEVFFFQTDDPRLIAGSHKFCRPEDQNVMTATWKDMKSQLQNDFRKRHQKAVRDQKTLKKWLKKPAKSSTK